MKVQSLTNNRQLNHRDIEKQANLLLSLIDDVTNLRHEAEQMLSMLTNILEQESNPLINKVVERIFEELRPPNPPPDISKMKEVETSLMSYREAMKNYILKARRYLDLVKKLSLSIKVLNENVESLEKWESLLKENYPHMFIRAEKMKTKAIRLMRVDEIPDIESYISQLSDVIVGIQELLRTCRITLERDVRRLYKKIEFGERLYKQVRGLVGINELQCINDKRMALESLKSRLDEILQKAPQIKVNILNIEKQIDGIIQYYRDLFNSLEREESFKVYKRLSEWKTLHDESMPLHIVVDRLSKKLSMSYATVLEALYELCKKNIVVIKVKVSDI